MSSVRTAVSIVFGATGAGKTALINRLVALRPAGERWAVLQNDFGTGVLDRESGAEDEVVVRPVSGCICCTARVALRSGIVTLLRVARPQRLLIEASAAAAPEAIAAVLREPGIANAATVGASLCAVSADQLVDERHAANAVYRQQIAAADVIVLVARSESDARRARAALSGFPGPARAVIGIAQADIGTLAKPR